MKGKFNTIKKSRKKSKDIDEKIEYLNKECQKTGLQEVMTTTGMYQGTTMVPNQDYINFNGLSQGGYPLGLSADEGDSLGGASIGTNPSTGQTGVALSPPHPVTGVRKVASTVLDGVGSNRALRPGIGARSVGTPPRLIYDGSAVWFFDPNYNGGEGTWYHFEWLDGQLGFWDTNFLGFFFHNTNLDQFQLSGVNIGTQVKDKISILSFGTNGAIGEPQTLVFTKDDLGDPSFLPINIDGMSPQAYQYLLDKTGTNIASGDVDFDLYNWYLKTYPNSGAAQWYLNNPNSNPRSNPFLKPTDYIPFTDRASNPNQPVSDTDIPGPSLGAQDGDMLALFGRRGDKTFDTTKKQNRRDTYGLINAVNSGDPLFLPPGVTMDQAREWVKNYNNGNLKEESNLKKYLKEGVNLGHFDPEVLNVDINDIRKGIMPEFPKDPPPEMIGGYSAKSRLVRKDPELPPFIKVTKKDLAKNHKLTDKEISQYMNEINAINDYIKKNPAELVYAMTRYPKDDPRLAQLNFKMDEMKRASDQYVETHFPENTSLFNKLQDKIIKNIEQTDPKNFTGHKEAPKFTETDISEQERRRKTIIRHFKKKK